ncbi:MAG: NlpC/P60 family protein [Pseudomonadota bacterium]
MIDDDSIAQRAKIVCEAFSWVGTPYRHQASAKGQGTDCLGLVRGVWRGLAGDEPEMPPPYTPNWVEVRADDPLLAASRRHLNEKPHTALLPGDMLLFRMVQSGPAKHCGIYAGEGRFIHAYSGRAVTVSSFSSWWQKRLVGVFSFPILKG